MVSGDGTYDDSTRMGRIMELLPDDFYSDNELAQRSIDMLKHHTGLSDSTKMIVAYELWSDVNNTGKVLVCAAEDVIDTMGAINHAWADSKLQLKLGAIGKPPRHWQLVLNAMYTVLDKYKYVPGKFNKVGSDLLYTNNAVISGLIED